MKRLLLLFALSLYGMECDIGQDDGMPVPPTSANSD